MSEKVNPRNVRCCSGCGRDTSHKSGFCDSCRPNWQADPDEPRGEFVQDVGFYCKECHRVERVNTEDLAVDQDVFCPVCKCQLTRD